MAIAASRGRMNQRAIPSNCTPSFSRRKWQPRPGGAAHPVARGRRRGREKSLQNIKIGRNFVSGVQLTDGWTQLDEKGEVQLISNAGTTRSRSVSTVFYAASDSNHLIAVPVILEQRVPWRATVSNRPGWPSRPVSGPGARSLLMLA